jgi:guanylate kinase
MQHGKAIIFSAPSGSGKTTIVKHLLRKHMGLEFSISATTRSRRMEKESDGKDYYFLTGSEFRKRVADGAFVEWEEVYGGIYYGTLKSEVERIWAAGNHVLFDVDVKGGIKLKEYFQERGLAVFVKVRDMEVLEDRLRHRNTETEENIQRRLAKAKYEMSFENRFDTTLVSDDLSETLRRAEQLVYAFIHQSANYS